MFGLGFFEILLILAGILIFIRPQDLPAFVYRVGKIYGQLKELYTKFWREANLLKNQIDEMVEKEETPTQIDNSDNTLTKKTTTDLNSNTNTSPIQTKKTLSTKVLYTGNDPAIEQKPSIKAKRKKIVKPIKKDNKDSSDNKKIVKSLKTENQAQNTSKQAKNNSKTKTTSIKKNKNKKPMNNQS